jgi:hypothetical protein
MNGVIPPFGICLHEVGRENFTLYTLIRLKLFCSVPKWAVFELYGGVLLPSLASKQKGKAGSGLTVRAYFIYLISENKNTYEI